MPLLDDNDIAKNAQRLRKPDGSPVIPRPVPEKPNEVALALEMCAKAIREMGAMHDALTAMMAKPAPAPQNDIATAAITKLLKQNGELIQAVKDVLEIRAHEERMEEEREPESWTFEIRDARGNVVKTITARSAS